MITTINAMYSPESISFQNDSFHKALTAIFEGYRHGDKAKSKPELEMALSKAIKDYTNMNFDVSIGDVQMATELPNIDKNSPLLEGYGWKDFTMSKQSLADIRKSSEKEVRGLLDPNRSWVDGYFAELPPIKMHLTESMIYTSKSPIYKWFDGREYSSAELSAIVLHEVGHPYALFDFLVRFRTQNQVLSTIVRVLDGTEDYGQREIIIREAADYMKLENVDAQALSTKKNTTVYTVIVSNLARKNKSQSGGEGYDINSFEQMADQFATRHGAGRDLVTALDKLHKGHIHRRGWAAYFFGEAFKLAVLGLGIFEVAIGNAYAAYLTFGTLTSLLLADSHHDWYDKGGARFKRIRNQLVERLKDEGIGKEESNSIREDIDAIDKVNEKYKDFTQLIGLVYDYLIPSGVSKRKEIEFQQSIEELSANKLFYFANKLKTA